MTFVFPHSAFTDDEFLGRDAIWVPDTLAAGLVTDSAMAGFLTDPVSGGVYAPTGTSSLRVVFSLGKEDVAQGGEMRPRGTIAEAGCATANVIGMKQKDSLYVDGITYYVLRVEPDETGWSTIYLGKRY